MTSDSKLLENLTSQDAKVVNAAVGEIMNRGEEIIPFLIQCKGDQRFFGGSLLRRDDTASVIFRPTSNSKLNKKLLKEGKFVTVEVAALHLITAIFYKDLYISQSPYLMDFSVSKEKRLAANTQQVVSKAWIAVESWYQKLKAEGIEKLRKDNIYPFINSDVRFW